MVLCTYVCSKDTRVQFAIWVLAGDMCKVWFLVCYM
ncbi:hypothetical protein LINPERHAP1_LOCUS42490 [Linum perenne]